MLALKTSQFLTAAGVAVQNITDRLSRIVKDIASSAPPLILTLHLLVTGIITMCTMKARTEGIDSSSSSGFKADTFFYMENFPVQLWRLSQLSTLSPRLTAAPMLLLRLLLI